MRERFYERLKFGCGGAHISRAMLYSYGCGGALSAPETLFASRAASMDFAADVGEWLSLVEHLVRDQGVGGSNPLSPTNLSSSPKILSVCDSPVWFAASEAHGCFTP